MTEKEKYECIWNLPGYRRYSPGENHVETFLKFISPNSIINDYGCGTGRASLKMKKAGHKVLMIDIASNALDEEVKQALDNQLKFVCKDLRNMNFDVPSSDWGYCCDVMEHIPPDDINKVLKAIKLRSPNIYFSIAGGPSAKWKGMDLHLTQRTQAWWERKLSQYWNIETLSSSGTNYCFVGRSHGISN